MLLHHCLFVGTHICTGQEWRCILAVQFSGGGIGGHGLAQVQHSYLQLPHILCNEAFETIQESAPVMYKYDHWHILYVQPVLRGATTAPFFALGNLMTQTSSHPWSLPGAFLHSCYNARLSDMSLPSCYGSNASASMQTALGCYGRNPLQRSVLMWIAEGCPVGGVGEGKSSAGFVEKEILKQVCGT